MFKICLITNQTFLAREAENCGVERIMIDLESHGKIHRQKNANFFIAEHTTENISQIKKYLRRSKLVVRINALNDKSKNEIDEVIAHGADIIILPMFCNAQEAERFVNYVDGRITTNLLVENKESVSDIQNIIQVQGVDEIHIGLNDLQLSMKLNNRFDCLLDGTLDHLSTLIRSKNISFGFGGITSPLVDSMPIKPGRIIAEQIRLKSHMAIFSRRLSTRLEDGSIALDQFSNFIQSIRNEQNHWQHASEENFDENRKILAQEVAHWNETLNLL